MSEMCNVRHDHMMHAIYFILQVVHGPALYYEDNLYIHILYSWTQAVAIFMAVKP